MSQASLVPPSPPLQGILPPCGLWWGHACVHTQLGLKVEVEVEVEIKIDIVYSSI